MPFEIFLLPGLIFFVYGFFRGKRRHKEEFTREEETS
jgi:hypothetical protein